MNLRWTIMWRGFYRKGIQNHVFKPWAPASNRSSRPVHGSPAANQRLAKYVRNGSTEQLHRSEWRFYHGQFCGVAFADRDAKPSQTVEPIAAETKRRLLSPLFLREFLQNRPMTTKKIRNIKPARELERFYPFHSMHY